MDYLDIPDNIKRGISKKAKCSECDEEAKYILCDKNSSFDSQNPIFSFVQDMLKMLVTNVRVVTVTGLKLMRKVITMMKIEGLQKYLPIYTELDSDGCCADHLNRNP